MDIDVVVTPGLGDNSYVLTRGDEAAVIDPQRDVDRFVDIAERRGATIRRVIETHVHNDYLSGAKELRSRTGAEIWGPVDAGYAFDHLPVEEATEIPLGGATLLALATPGHTPEHTSYLLRDEDGEQLAVFSGGSLTVGSVGRTDLLGPERADELARLQYRSVKMLASLPDGVALLPTHGAGSFCSVGPGEEGQTSSIGEQRARNPALQAPDEEAFVDQQRSGLMAFPTYYAYMAPINRAGPPPLGEIAPPSARTPDEVATQLEGGAKLVDARDGAAFAAAHVAGSLSIPFEPSFASYVGWLLPFGMPVILLAPDGDVLADATMQLRRIGWDAIPGHLAGGIDAWQASGRATASYPAITLDGFVDELAEGDARDVLDVRQRSEWDAGHLEGSRHLFVGDLPEQLDQFGSAPQTIVCASGYRSSMAASLLDGAGVDVRLVVGGGVPRALRLLASRGRTVVS